METLGYLLVYRAFGVSPIRFFRSIRAKSLKPTKDFSEYNMPAQIVQRCMIIPFPLCCR